MLEYFQQDNTHSAVWTLNRFVYSRIRSAFRLSETCALTRNNHRRHQKQTILCRGCKNERSFDKSTQCQFAFVIPLSEQDRVQKQKELSDEAECVLGPSSP